MRHSETAVERSSSNCYAWRRAGSGWDVQLCFVGRACSSGSPFTSGAEADGPGAAVVERGVRPAVCCDRPSLDCAGVYSAGLVVAGVLLDPFGAAVGRADRLQPAVSL